ncbi:MAG TPA: molybdopterin cofactor-binding domain-containing protein [Devosiaceae bacterium]|nr:molybdopterin cofactor-binding domain-containing protein [Devosiaceae bacterium]
MDDFKKPGGITRRNLLAGGGALVVSFSLTQAFGQSENPPPPPPPTADKPTLPGALNDDPFLDSWIKIDGKGAITVFTGKAELGQGIKTSIPQCAAEELDVPFDAIKLITADTFVTPNEGFTAGSMSMLNSGTAVRNAAAQIRELLIAQAAVKLGVDPATLHAEDGHIVGAKGEKLAYADVVGNIQLHVNAQPVSKLKATKDFKVMGKAQPRVDIPGKVTGGQAFVQDMRPEGMLHGRVVRPPSYHATLIDADIATVEKMPGVVKVVRDGSYLGIIAEQEWQAVKAMRALARSAKWNEKATLPDINHLPETLKSLAVQDGVVADNKTPAVGVVKTVDATFTRPYQMHGSIGPSCAVGHLVDGVTTVWTHTQGVYPDRDAIAQLLGVDKPKVRCIHTEGSGCYGHNGADDAAGDAALLAQQVPGKPVRVQFMREQEHAWDPFGPGMVTHIKIGLNAENKMAAWDYELWSNSHGSRPGSAGALVSSRYLSKPFPEDPQKLVITPLGSGDRNADPLGYDLPHKHVIWHFIKDQPVRQSSMRALGAYCNVFSMESAVGEAAILAGADQVEFRLSHVKDPRGIDVINAAAKNFGWTDWKPAEGRGRGFAYARYKNHACYLAIAVEIEVDKNTGKVRLVRANVGIDSGEIVNPDGIKNQTEGGIIQSMSWTLFEAVQFDRTRITSVDWQTYPIARFGSIPDSIDIEIVPRPGQGFLGTGEGAQGPTAAAIGNAIRDAIGKRLYDLPLTPDKVLAAMAAPAAA